MEKFALRSLKQAGKKSYFFRRISITVPPMDQWKMLVTPIVITDQILRHSCTESWFWEKGYWLQKTLSLKSCCLVMAVKFVGFGSSLPEANIWKWMVGFDENLLLGMAEPGRCERLLVSGSVFQKVSSIISFFGFLLSLHLFAGQV